VIFSPDCHHPRRLMTQYAVPFEIHAEDGVYWMPRPRGAWQ
jgi:hypothetical protein